MNPDRCLALIRMRFHDAPFTAADLAAHINTGSPAARALHQALATAARTPFATPA